MIIILIFMIQSSMNFWFSFIQHLLNNYLISGIVLKTFLNFWMIFIACFVL
jgi:hypothetical protein